jgi:ABC-2 type transport system permease protein
MSGFHKALEIARVNLLRQVRDRGDLFFVFVLPTIIIVALGIQFGGSSTARLGVVGPGGDPMASALVQALREADVRFDVRPVADEATLRAAVERGNLEAGVVIPVGYGAALAGTGAVEVKYLGTSQGLAAGLRTSVEAAVAGQAALVAASRAAVAVGAGGYDRAFPVAEARLADVAGVTVSVSRIGEAGAFAGYSQFTFGAQSQLILFMFLTSMTAAGRLVLTRRLGISRRMVSTPTAIPTIVAGEALGRLGVALLQGVFIVLMTAFVFNVSWGDPVAAAAIVVSFGLVGAGVALLIGAISTNADQASSLGVFAGLALGALGGCMVPLNFMPETMRTFANVIPHSWAISGLQSLVRDGGGLASVAPNIAVLLAYGIVLLALASWRFRKAISG